MQAKSTSLTELLTLYQHSQDGLFVAECAQNRDKILAQASLETRDLLKSEVDAHQQEGVHLGERSKTWLHSMSRTNGWVATAGSSAFAALAFFSPIPLLALAILSVIPLAWIIQKRYTRKAALYTHEEAMIKVLSAGDSPKQLRQSIKDWQQKEGKLNWILENYDLNQPHLQTRSA